MQNANKLNEKVTKEKKEREKKFHKSNWVRLWQIMKRPEELLHNKITFSSLNSSQVKLLCASLIHPHELHTNTFTQSFN